MISKWAPSRLITACCQPREFGNPEYQALCQSDNPYCFSVVSLRSRFFSDWCCRVPLYAAGLRVWSLPENADTNKGEATSTGSRTPPAKSCRKSPKCIPSTSQLTRLDSQSSRLVASPPSHDDISYLSCSDSRSMRYSPHVSIDTPFTCVYRHTLHPHIPPLGVHRSPERRPCERKNVCCTYMYISDETFNEKPSGIRWTEALSSRHATTMLHHGQSSPCSAPVFVRKTNEGEIFSSTTLRVDNVPCYMYLV